MTAATHAFADPGVTDAQLVARVLGGERSAYGVLVRRHQASIYRLSRGLGIDHDTTLDVLQDAFVRAYERLSDCREAAHYRAWLYRICRNLCLDKLRSNEWLPVPLSDVSDAESIEDARAGPSDVDLTMRAALGRLPLALREAFLLKHDAGYTYDEIASLTDASPSAVKMRVHRARESLRAFLIEQGIEAA